MKRKTENTILNLFRKFQETVLDSKPNPEKMYFEVRMMNFKIRPVKGDVSLLRLKDKKIIEVLWSLGKLDEFFQKEFENLKPKHRDLFFNFFENLNRKYQDELNDLNLKHEKITSLPTSFEMEIFKEPLMGKRTN